MAYFRNKSRAAAVEAIPAHPVDSLLSVDEDSLQRESEILPEPEPEPPAAQPESPPQAELQQPEPPQDATQALRAQFEAQRRADEIQRQRQAAAAAEQRRADWLKATPLAQQNVNALGWLHHEALKAGFNDLSAEYFSFLETGLKGLEQPQEQPAEVGQMMPVDRPAAAAAAAPAPAAPQPTPEFFRPPPPLRMPGPPEVPVSAPVSRSIPTAADRAFETNPHTVRLSPAQREAARLAGISDLEYARGVVRLEREKAEGGRQR